MDSKEPDWSKFQEFLNSEVRYTSLQKSNPTEAVELYTAAQNNAMWRYKSYVRLANSQFDKFDETTELPN
jgi:pyruvate-ferredoxin/flavodoxin oxidoreductase